MINAMQCNYINTNNVTLTTLHKYLIIFSMRLLQCMSYIQIVENCNTNILFSYT